MQRRIRTPLRMGFIALRLAPLALVPNAFGIGNAVAGTQFNLDFLRGNASAGNVAALSSPGAVLPGTHPFAIYLNGDEIAREPITFVSVDGTRAVPCLSPAHLRRWGIRVDHNDNAARTAAPCLDLDATVPGATISYNGNQQRIDLSVPQLQLLNLPRGHIPIALRDQGINALLLDYAVNGTHAMQDEHGSASHLFASINTGLNIGMWRFRHTASITRTSPQSRSSMQWRTRGFTAETDLGSSHSRLLLGDAHTSPGILDSVRFRGARISSDDEMLPFSQRSFAPVVRGIAASNARIEIRQDGHLIHAINVAPGPFEINDIVPNRMSGKLHVSITESDGSIQRYTREFSAVETMLRPGHSRFELSAGQLRDGEDRYTPKFLQFTGARGLTSNTTPHIGALFAENYRSMALGVAQSLGTLGSASIDITHARTRLAAGGDRHGQSYRVLYSKSLDAHGTEFRLIGHRYSTSGYYDFAEAAAERRYRRGGHYENGLADLHANDDTSPPWAISPPPITRSFRYHNKRSRFEIAVSQRVSDKHALHLSYDSQDYWGASAGERSLQAGLNGHTDRFNYGLFFRDSQSRYLPRDRSLALTVSLPLERLASRRVSGIASYGHSQHSGASYQAGINGTALEDDRLGYGMSIGTTDRGRIGMLNARYMGSKGILHLTASSAETYRQLSWGAYGGAVLHRDGLTFAQALQQTNVLVHAPDGAGIGVDNQSGLRLDRRGYAVVTGISAYRGNRIALRSDQLGADIDASRITQNTIPTRGALARIDFDTRRGMSLMIRSHLPDGTAIPLGAMVFDVEGRSRGVADPNGDAFVSGVRAGEQLQVHWGTDADQRCQLQLGSAATSSSPAGVPGYRHVELPCMPASEKQ